MQCTFLLVRFPFENVRCVLYLELQDRQLWDLQNINVTVPTFKHFSYLVSVSSQAMNFAIINYFTSSTINQ